MHAAAVYLMLCLQRSIATEILSVRLLHAGVVSRRIQLRSRDLHHRITSPIILVFGEVRTIWKFGDNQPSDGIKSPLICKF